MNLPRKRTKVGIEIMISKVLLIEKGVITQDEFMEEIKAERATYQAMFQKVR